MSTSPVTQLSNISAVRKTTPWLNVMVVLACLSSFMAIAALVVAGQTQAWDEQVLVLLRDPVDPSVPAGAEFLGETARDVTSMGGFAVLIAVSVLSVLYFRLNDDVRAGRFVGVTIVLGFVISMILKSAFARPRPDIVPHLTGFTMSSFPSSHAMMSAIIYPTLAWMLTRTIERRGVRVFFWTVAFMLSIVIGLSRVYVGVHYPSDVLAGWCAGFGWLTLCAFAAPWFQLNTGPAVDRST